MKCPDCSNELKKVDNVPFANQCTPCNRIWVIQTMEESIAMGNLNTELLGRTDLSQEQKVDLIVQKAYELESNR